MSMMCRCLGKDAFDILIICSKRPETPVDFKSMFAPEVKFLPVDMAREISFFKDLNAFFKIKKIIQIEQPDIVHLHSSKAGFLGRLACKLTRAKQVYHSPHGFSFLRTDVGKTKRKIFYYLEKLAARFGGIITACSGSEYDAGSKVSRQITILPNAVDLDEIDRIPPGDRSTKIKVGISGRITDSKNPALFASLSREVMKQTPQTEFIWIGDCVRPQKVGEAVRQGYDAAMDI